MRMILRFKYIYFLMGLFLLVVWSPIVVVGCECTIPTVCQAFTKADAVFIGKVTNVKEINTPSSSYFVVDFTVEKSFKGSEDATEVVKFQISDCFQISFAVGERYYVYKDPKESRSICNRTNTVENSAAEIDYAEKVLRNNDLRTIGGFLYGLSKEELRLTKVIIVTSKERYDVEVNQDGLFTFSISSQSDFVVKISLPFNATIYMKDLDVTYPTSGRAVEYAFRLEPGDCSYREISVSRMGTSP